MFSKQFRHLSSCIFIKTQDVFLFSMNNTMNHIIQGSLVTSLENVFKIIFEMQDVKNKSEVFCAFIMLIS